MTVGGWKQTTSMVIKLTILYCFFIWRLQLMLNGNESYCYKIEALAHLLYPILAGHEHSDTRLALDNND